MAYSLATRAYDALNNHIQHSPYRWLSATTLASVLLTSYYMTRTTPSDKELASILKRNRESGQCRYRFDKTSSATCTLPDGRKLGYTEYGSMTGKPVLYMHGFPGSRIEAVMFDGMAVRAGVRIIAVDRPGIGLSSPHPKRTVLTFAKDVEDLAESLDLKEYGVLAQSGGGPYALACAYSLPADKLKAVAIVCGLGPPDMSKKGMQWLNWIGYVNGNIRRFPAFVRWWFRRQPQGRLDLTREKRLELVHQQFLNSNPNQKDIDALVHKDPDLFRSMVHTFEECIAQGFEGISEDGKVLCTPFGFRIEDIRPNLPMRLWYGKQDVNVPAEHGVQIAARLAGDKVLLRIEDETHASLEINWDEEALKDLVENM